MLCLPHLPALLGQSEHFEIERESRDRALYVQGIQHANPLPPVAAGQRV